jgi:hypothetical protein
MNYRPSSIPPIILGLLAVFQAPNAQEGADALGAPAHGI